MCTYTLTLSLFMFLSHGILFYLQKFSLTFIQKECVSQKWLFLFYEINCCCNEMSFFYIKLLFRTNVSQNGFNLNQIESQVYSKFQCDTLVWKNLVQRSSEIYLRGYFTSIFTDIVLYYCYCCCCSSFLTKTQNLRRNCNIKGALSGLRQFLATESLLKMM